MDDETKIEGEHLLITKSKLIRLAFLCYQYYLIFIINRKVPHQPVNLYFDSLFIDSDTVQLPATIVGNTSTLLGLLLAGEKESFKAILKGKDLDLLSLSTKEEEVGELDGKF